MKIRVKHDGKFKGLNSKDQFLDSITDLNYTMKLDETIRNFRCYYYVSRLGFTGIESIRGCTDTGEVYEFAIPY